MVVARRGNRNVRQSQGKAEEADTWDGGKKVHVYEGDAFHGHQGWRWW